MSKKATKFAQSALLIAALLLVGGGGDALKAQSPQEAKIAVSGVVSDAEGTVIGASVIEKGNPGNGVATDVDGRYTLRVSPNATLQVAFIGYITQEVAVNGRTSINVTLHEDTKTLDEVVVTALGITREKKALGYSVTEVNGEEMLKSRGGLSNPINALQGKVAGLQISSGSGNIGGSSKINIRGNHSISGSNQPLFVIDGVPIDGDDRHADVLTRNDVARGAGGYDYGNMIQDINPDDVASISVLKGANASALYGSRATNGVILITTKSGKKGEGYNVTFNSSVGFERVNKLPKLQKLYGGGYGSDFEEVKINGKTYNYPDYATDESWGPKYENQDVLSWYDLAKWEAGGKVGDPTTSKWQTPKHDIEEFFETGVSFTNNVAISQSTDLSAVRISFTNSDLKGYIPNSSLKKNVINLAASTTSADKKLEVFTNITYFNSAAKGRSEIGYGDNNAMVKFVQWGHRDLDLQEAKDLYKFPDGTQASWNRSGWDDPTPAYSNSPYWIRNMNYETDNRNRVYGNVGFSYKILPTLKFQYKSNLDFWVDKQFERIAVFSQEESKYKETSRQQYELNNEALLSYNDTFNDFSLSANLGGNLMSRRYEHVLGETVGGLAIPEFYNLKNSISAPTSKNDLREKAINSVFANATIGYKNTYYLEVSARNDWASTLPKGKNSYLYPSITGSFIFSELTKENLDWLSFGKLRAGYAYVGGDTDPYRVIDTYTQHTNIDEGNGTPGYVLDITLNNQSLKPESTGSFEVGLEMNFFKDRIGFEATYYSTATENQIIPLTVSGTTGYRERVINAGLITNKGFEFALHGSPVKTRDFEWSSILTLASNTNKVEELVEGTDYYRLVSAPFKVEVGAVKGEAYGIIMGTDYVYDDNGNKVVGEDGLYLATSGNKNIGNVFPDFTGGWNNTFRYKNWDLNVLLDFSKGGHYFSTSYMWGMYSGMLEESAANGIREKGLVLPGVQEDGTPNVTIVDAQVYAESLYTGPAAQNVFKSDYLKLREVAIGYNFPLASRYFVKSLRLSAYGRNLGVWGPDTKHFDPETIITNSGNIQGIEGGALPSVANFGVSIGLKF